MITKLQGFLGCRVEMTGSAIPPAATDSESYSTGGDQQHFCVETWSRPQTSQQRHLEMSRVLQLTTECHLEKSAS